jgi:hypothetical protein
MLGEASINSIEEYLQIIKENKKRNIKNGNQEDFLFRGQKDDLPLIPKIARLKPKGELFSTELLLLQEFKRTNPLLIDAQQAMDDWDYLTIGQHFGLPTRLLDWSNNALTALWFAIWNVDEEIKEQQDAIIWILMAEAKDFDLNIEKVHPFDIKETKIFRPRIIKQRINNQSGVFCIQSSNEIQEKLALNDADSFSQKLLKIKIPSESFQDIRTDLNTLGVNAFTIFPELEGLCSHLQWRYFYNDIRTTEDCITTA